MARRNPIPEELWLLMEWAAKLSGIAAAGALLWLLTGLFSGDTAPSPDPAKTQRVMHVVSNFTSIFQIAALVCGITAAIITYESRDAMFALGAAGITCVVGLPALVQFQMGKSFPARFATPAETLLTSVFTQTGYIITAAALVRGVIFLVQNVADFGRSLVSRGSVGFQKEAARNSIRSKNPSMFTPCWKLPYCRDGVREICPAFLAKKTCWKFGSGCYCDDDMILKIITAEPMSGGSGAFLHAALQDAKSTTKRKGKPPCDRCYIFLEHQRLKHNLLSPLVVPLSIGLMYVGYDTYKRLFEMGVGVVVKFWSAISYNPAAVTATRPPDWLAASEYLFAIVAGFFLLVYLTKALEYAIFKLRL